MKMNQIRADHLRASLDRVLIVLVAPMIVAVSVLSAVSSPVAADDSQHPILFPVAREDFDGLEWSDTFGAPRSGGRSHIGVDLLGTKGMKLVAVRDSTVVWGRFNNASGTIVRLRDADGWEYQYIHINNDSPGTDNGQATCLEALSAKLCDARDGSSLTSGTQVAAGEFIGFLGDAGNAEATPPHLHFEIYRPDGRAVNPTPFVDAAVNRTVSLSTTETVSGPTGSAASHLLVERELGRVELVANAGDAGSKISARVNGRAATDAEVATVAGKIGSVGLAQVIAETIDANPAVASIDRLYLTFFLSLIHI